MAACVGSAEAQKQLYDRYAARMMAVCLRYAQTSFEAEDVLQEGFVTVFRTLPGFGASARWSFGFGEL